MKKRVTSWGRGAALLAVLGVVVAGLLASSVGAATPFLKKRTYNKNEGIFASFKDGPTDIASVGPFPAPPAVPPLTTIASLSVPKGKYAINAKLYVEASTSFNDIHCRLVAGTDFDQTLIVSNDDAEFTAMSLQVVHNFTAPGAVTLGCADDAAAGDMDDQARFIKITAIRARSVVNVPSP